jgi:hypothetical protein
VATVHYSLVVGGVTYRQSQTDNFPKGYPVFQRMAPTDAPIGGAPFTLHCYGVDFDPAAKIVWNGGEEPTTFIDSTHLTTGVQPGTAVVTTSVPVSIRNPTADSDSIWFAFVGTGQADLPPTKF